LLALTIAQICLAPHATSADQLSSLVGTGFVTLVGFGLLWLRKWAALYLSIPWFCFGGWLFVTSIEQIPFPWNLFYMYAGISLMLPLLVMIRVWSQLTWRGRYFF